jgi:hypothetical protein
MSQLLTHSFSAYYKLLHRCLKTPKSYLIEKTNSEILQL